MPSKPKPVPAPLDSPRGHIGENVRRLRNAMNLSQEKLGEMASFHRTYVSQVERRITNISIDRLESLARLLGVEAIDLMQPPPPEEEQEK